MWNKFIWSLFLALGSLTGFAQDLSAYKAASFTDGADTLKYRILYPENFNPGQQYPVMLFLHGRGESGNDNKKQLTHGAKMFLSAEFRKSTPAIVIFPQCAEDSYWANVQIESVGGKRFFTFVKGGAPTASMNLLLKFMDSFVKQPFVNQARIYAGGLSMGGMGTFEILRRRPKLFAAAFAICGGDEIANVKKYKQVPLWIFHGGLDDIVSPQFSYGVYRTLKKLGHEPRFTIYPKANHNSWDSAFAEPGLLPWLFSQIKQ